MNEPEPATFSLVVIGGDYRTLLYFIVWHIVEFTMLVEHATDTLYERTGKLPVYDSGDTYSDPDKEAFLQEYMCSVPMPKMIETSNFWVEMEITFARIWDGEDANRDLKALSEKIMSQVVGGQYEEEYIDVPQETTGEEETEEGMEDGGSTEDGENGGEETQE